MHPVQQLNNWSAWAIPNPRRCPCRNGWLLSDWDTWHHCGLHGGTPHPEDDEAQEEFDYEGHRLRKMREAFVIYRQMSGMDSAAFKAAVVRRAGAEATPQGFVDAAEGIAEEISRDRREAEARGQGYSCGLEMMLAEEAQREQRHGPDY